MFVTRGFRVLIALSVALAVATWSARAPHAQAPLTLKQQLLAGGALPLTLPDLLRLNQQEAEGSATLAETVPALNSAHVGLEELLASSGALRATPLPEEEAALSAVEASLPVLEAEASAESDTPTASGDAE